jgi:hypothetical protein
LRQSEEKKEMSNRSFQKPKGRGPSRLEFRVSLQPSGWSGNRELNKLHCGIESATKKLIAVDVLPQADIHKG